MFCLESQQVVKRYAAHLALDKVSISVPENSIFGLLGPNGAGKTTLIRIINQITGPDEGQILLKGHPLAPEDIARIGYLPEERGLYKKMKVGEQALYLARLKGMSRPAALKRLKYWFEKFEIQPWWDKKVEELSKGMQQKVQFIVTILHEPELLIFDEPFSGFDPINANLLKEEILELKKKGSTIIFSTHNMSSVEELCDHITLVNNGKAILSGPVPEVRQQFSQNLIELEFSGSLDALEGRLSDHYKIETRQSLQERHKLLIRMPQDAAPNALLAALSPAEHLHAYHEVLPGMNEVFITVVNQNKTSR